MKIAVIGPGAMGLLFGSYLSQHHDVTLVGTNPAKMQSITENGVTIREMDGSERTYHPRATADTAALSPVDLVIVQVKASIRGRADQKPKPHRARDHPDDPAKRHGARCPAQPFRRARADRHWNHPAGQL